PLPRVRHVGAPSRGRLRAHPPRPGRRPAARRRARYGPGSRGGRGDRRRPGARSGPGGAVRAHHPGPARRPRRLDRGRCARPVRAEQRGARSRARDGAPATRGRRRHDAGRLGPVSSPAPHHAQSAPPRVPGRTLVVRGVLALLLGATVGVIGTVSHRGEWAGLPTGLALALLLTLSTAVLCRAWSGTVTLLTAGAGWLVAV